MSGPKMEEGQPNKKQRTDHVRCGVVVFTAEGVGEKKTFDPVLSHQQVREMFAKSLLGDSGTANKCRIKNIFELTEENNPLVIVNVHGDSEGNVYLRGKDEKEVPYSPFEFAKLFANRKISGVVLLSCHGKKTAEELSRVAPFVIYHKGTLAERHVTEYLGAFHSSLRDGKSVHHAHLTASNLGHSGGFRMSKSGRDLAKLVHLSSTSSVYQRFVEIKADDDACGQEFDGQYLQQQNVSIVTGNRASGQEGMNGATQELVKIHATGRSVGQKFCF